MTNTSSKPRFKVCRDRATKLLYQQECLGRALSVRKLIYDKHIVFDTIQNYSDLTGIPEHQLCHSFLKDGCMLHRGNVNIVLYDKATFGHWERFNWTLAHEVGHIYMEHQKHGPVEEVEAHFFASQLFMPEYTIRQMVEEYRVIDAHDLSQIFWVSTEAAVKRIRTLKKHHTKEWLPEDLNIYERLCDRIDSYFYCKENELDFRKEIIDRSLLQAEQERERYEMIHCIG